MYKKGDKVTYIKHDTSPEYIEDDMLEFTIGKEYVIERVAGDHHGGVWYDLIGVDRGVWEWQISKRVRNTKLARKMYPDHKVVDNEWIEKHGGEND